MASSHFVRPGWSLPYAPRRDLLRRIGASTALTCAVACHRHSMPRWWFPAGEEDSGGPAMAASAAGVGSRPRTLLERCDLWSFHRDTRLCDLGERGA